MRVLFLRSSIGFGGAEIYNLNLLRQADKSDLGWQAVFLTNNKILKDKLEDIGVETCLVEVGGEELGSKKSLLRFLINSPFFFFNYFKTIFSLRERFDLVIIQSGTEKIALTCFLKLLRKKVVWLEHGPVFAFRKFWLVNFLYLINSRLVDLVVTVSDQAKKDLIDGGVGEEKVLAVKTGIDVKNFSPLSRVKRQEIRKTSGFKMNDFVIGFVGAVCFEKGIDEFLKTAFVLLSKAESFKFLVVGNGSELSWAKKEVRGKGYAPAFVFPGFKENVQPLLGSIDLFLFPTRHLEGLSLTLMEAMAMEGLVLVRDVGGNREIVVDGKSGYLYKNKTVSQLADLILKISQDRQRVDKIRQAARKRIIARFNQKNWVENLDKVFRSTL